MILWIATACSSISARVVSGGVDTVAKAACTASVGAPMPTPEAHGQQAAEALSIRHG